MDFYNPYMHPKPLYIMVVISTHNEPITLTVKNLRPFIWKHHF